MENNQGLMSLFQKRLVVVSISMATSVYVWAACGNAISVPMTPEVVNSPKLSAEKGIQTALNAYDERLSVSMQTHEASIMAALAILTKQKEIDADYISQSDDRSNQVLASVINETEKMDIVKKVIENNSSKGQGHNPCLVLSEQKELAIATQEADGNVYGAVRHEITAAPGKYENRADVIAQRTVIHDANYCTADQAASGLCSKAAPRAAKSLKATTLFTPSAQGDTIHEDKIAFINNIVGYPAEPLSASQSGTVGGASYIGNVHRLNALKSPAMAVLKGLQAEYTSSSSQAHFNEPSDTVDNTVSPESGVQADGTVDISKIDTTTEANQALKLEMEGRSVTGVDGKADGDVTAVSTASTAALDGDALPMMLQLEKQISRYLGNGPEYKAWNETLIQQNEKGLLKEVLQIKATGLYLQAREYENLLGMEAMLAATVAADLRSSGLESKVANARTNAVKNAVGSAIRK